MSLEIKSLCLSLPENTTNQNARILPMTTDTVQRANDDKVDLVVKRLYRLIRKEPRSLLLDGTNNSPSWSGLKRVLLAMNIHKDSIFVDFGCGFGIPSIATALLFGCKCYGIDYHPSMAKEATTMAKEAGVSHLCTFERLDFLDMPSDWITSRGISHVYTFDPVVNPDAHAAMTNVVELSPDVQYIASSFGADYWAGTTRIASEKISMLTSGQSFTMSILERD